jgi:hypothetical protein
MNQASQLDERHTNQDLKKAPIARGLFCLPDEEQHLLRQEVALARYVAIKLEVRTHDDRLV